MHLEKHKNYRKLKAGFKGELVKEKDHDDVVNVQSEIKDNTFKTPPNKYSTKEDLKGVKN